MGTKCFSIEKDRRFNPPTVPCYAGYFFIVFPLITIFKEIDFFWVIFQALGFVLTWIATDTTLQQWKQKRKFKSTFPILSPSVEDTRYVPNHMSIKTIKQSGVIK